MQPNRGRTETGRKSAADSLEQDTASTVSEDTCDRHPEPIPPRRIPRARACAGCDAARPQCRVRRFTLAHQPDIFLVHRRSSRLLSGHRRNAEPAGDKSTARVGGTVRGGLAGCTTPRHSRETQMKNHEHHDDFGGLHRDLLATGAAMDRRELFRIAARLGAGVSALSILGCGEKHADVAEFFELVRRRHRRARAAKGSRGNGRTVSG